MIKPSLSDLKEALLKVSLLLSPGKKQWLLNNAPKSFTYRQRLVLAFAQGKLANNPQCNWETIVRSRLRVSKEDFDVVNNYLVDTQ